MVTVGRATASHWRMADEPQFAHERADSLSLDRSRAVAAQLCADAALAVGWPLPSDSLAMRPHLLLLRVCGGHPAEPLVRRDAPAWQVKRGADHCQRIRRVAATERVAHREPRLPAESSTAFFAPASSSVKRPTSRSNSATRCSACWLRSSPANTLAAGVTTSAFHRLSRSGLRCYSRQISDARFCPLRTSRTTRALNSALNWRR